MNKMKILETEMINAMKAGQKLRKQVIASVIGNIKKLAIDRKTLENITDELVDEVLLKEKKTVQEMIDSCPETRIDLLEEYNARLVIIEEFAPKMLTRDEIIMELAIFCELENIELAKANRAIIMRGFMPTIKGRAEGKLVNQIIMEALK